MNSESKDFDNYRSKLVESSQERINHVRRFRLSNRLSSLALSTGVLAEVIFVATDFQSAAAKSFIENPAIDLASGFAALAALGFARTARRQTKDLKVMESNKASLEVETDSHRAFNLAVMSMAPQDGPFYRKLENQLNRPSSTTKKV